MTTFFPVRIGALEIRGVDVFYAFGISLLVLIVFVSAGDLGAAPLV